MKKAFCIDCKYPLVRRLEEKHGTPRQKTCSWATRMVAPRASRIPMRSKKK